VYKRLAGCLSSKAEMRMCPTVLGALWEYLLPFFS